MLKVKYTEEPLPLLKADTECAVRVDELVWPSRGS